jgi:hypothetical protein
MISETSFSRGYSFFWTENTPWIGNFVSSINVGFVERVFSPIAILDDPGHRSINNVVAFTLFKNILSGNNDSIDDAFRESIRIIENYPRNNLDSFNLTDTYRQIIKTQSIRLIKQYSGLEIEFFPQFPGCGIMESCQGDLYYDKTLVEVKAGNQAFKPSDIKQIIVYCALNWLSKNPLNIENVELINPRQGTLWRSSLSDLIFSISNLPMEDLFDQFGKYLSSMSEDIQLE